MYNNIYLDLVVLSLIKNVFRFEIGGTILIKRINIRTNIN